jgi:hypothetical protein
MQGAALYTCFYVMGCCWWWWWHLLLLLLPLLAPFLGFMLLLPPTARPPLPAVSAAVLLRLLWCHQCCLSSSTQGVQGIHHTQCCGVKEHQAADLQGDAQQHTVPHLDLPQEGLK